ncbi:MAG: S-layer family protein [Phormidesmis sp. RL_2_1]|nr:S-layer family protein [Phormidesmis sp. RL_2_1]
MTTERLEVLNGAQVTTGTAGEGIAGNITANVGSLLVQGTGTGDNQPSRLTASSNSDFAAGSLLITARDGVALRDGAELSVSSLFAGNAGNLSLAAESLRLTNGSRIEARTTAGNQGNIDLATNQLILLDQASLITTDATNTATGGNINIKSPIIVGNGNSDITANAVEGAGGNISITAEGLFGLEFRTQLTSANDITASSEVGLNGNVEINLPVIDPANALAQLPTVVLDPSDQVAAGCIADTGSSFIVTGRGGVPADPSQGQLEGSSLQAFALSPEGASAETWVSTTTTTTTVAAPPSPTASASFPPAASQEEAPLEANNWHYNAKGEVQLIAAVANSASLNTAQPLLQNTHSSTACLGERVG